MHKPARFAGTNSLRFVHSWPKFDYGSNLCRCARLRGQPFRSGSASAWVCVRPWQSCVVVCLNWLLGPGCASHLSGVFLGEVNNKRRRVSSNQRGLSGFLRVGGGVIDILRLISRSLFARAYQTLAVYLTI